MHWPSKVPPSCVIGERPLPLRPATTAAWVAVAAAARPGMAGGGAAGIRGRRKGGRDPPAARVRRREREENHFRARGGGGGGEGGICASAFAFSVLPLARVSAFRCASTRLPACCFLPLFIHFFCPEPSLNFMHCNCIARRFPSPFITVHMMPSSSLALFTPFPPPLPRVIDQNLRSS